MTNSKVIEAAKNRLIEFYQPVTIYLFGSFAYGEPSPDSDLDICVITDTTGKRKIDIIRDIRRKLAPIMNLPMDIVVYSEAEFSERAVLSTTLEYKIMHEGLKLYG